MKLNVGKYTIHRRYWYWDGQEWDDFPFFSQRFSASNSAKSPSHQTFKLQPGNLGWGENISKAGWKMDPV